MANNRAYSTFADFEREEIRPSMRIGWSVDELEDASGEQFDFDSDPFDAGLWGEEYESEESSEE